MRYDEFRVAIANALRGRPAGMTWVELRDALALPYDRLCPAWAARLERDVGCGR